MAMAYMPMRMMREAMPCRMNCILVRCQGDGGGGEIRTRGGVAATRLFESRTLNRSDTPPGVHSNPHPDPSPSKWEGIMVSLGLRFLAGTMARDLRPVAAAAHTAPLPLAGGRGVLEHPAALRVFAHLHAGGRPLDQLTRDRLGKPRGGAVDRVALVPVVERDAVRPLDQLIDVVRAQRPVDLG